EGDRPTGADRVETELVAPLRCAQHHLGVADAAERPEREQALILDAHSAVADCVEMLAADRARHPAGSGLRARRTELFGGQTLHFIERAALKVPGRQRAEAVERQQVGGGAKLAVLRRS